MAIKTGAIYKTLTFDGLNSGDYGVYITGSAVYNSPEKDVEMISVPGRNGAFALDRGRFQNIEVSYPAGLYGVDPEDFADAISDFRNAIGSRTGYCRLEDDYNPEEYRLAVFKAGLEVNPASLESGEFTITFDCKPQRFLTSGETAVAISSGYDINNPTLQEARPMLQVWGYGDIDLGGQKVSLADQPLGETLALNKTTKTGANISIPIDYSQANNGDALRIEGIVMDLAIGIDQTKIQVVDSITILSSLWSTGSGTITGSDMLPLSPTIHIIARCDPVTVTVGSVGGMPSVTSMSVRITGHMKATPGTTVTGEYTITSLSIGRTAAGSLLATYGNATITLTSGTAVLALPGSRTSSSLTVGPAYIDSTISAPGTPSYIDLDIGEAYKYKSGELIDLNNAVTLPPTLPTLPPGNTAITYSGTVTQLKIVPRWWKL